MSAFICGILVPDSDDIEFAEKYTKLSAIVGNESAKRLYEQRARYSMISPSCIVESLIDDYLAGKISADES